MSDENHDEVVEQNETEEIEETANEVSETEIEQEEKEEEEEQEEWQKADDGMAPVPVNTHIRMKQKLKGRLSEKDSEIEKLKEQIRSIENNIQTKKSGISIKRPQEFDYDSDDEYQQALSKYEDDLITSKLNDFERKRQQEQMYKNHQRSLVKAVEDHYERAAKLIDQAGISPDIYKASDEAVRKAVDSIAPGRGDIIVDQMIANMGDGSDKVMYYLGRSSEPLNSFKSLLIEDPSGIKAAMFLGEQKRRLTAPKKMKSRAPAPSPTANGDATMNSNIAALQKKYNEAHKKGNLQLAWEYRREARKAGTDTSKW